VAHAFAEELLLRNWEPIVVTHSPAPAQYDERFGYEVVRAPGWGRFREVLKSSDCVVFVHLSAVYIGWSAFCGTPIVSSIQGQTWNFKNFVAGAMTLLFEGHLRLRPFAALISTVVRAPATRHSPIIGNPFDGAVFHGPALEQKPGTLLYSGRITRGKGVFDLVEALGILRARGHALRLSFVGSGPEETALKESIAGLGLEESVSFAGPSEPARVAQLLREHQIAAIPSCWDEPFGIVALEAIACGAYVVAYPDGGLVEAVGAAGLLTEEKSAAALARGIERVLTEEALRASIDAARPRHLETYSRSAVVAKLLEVIDRACKHP
jgi:glycosyltransferase involved in cell wall biosynthesis